MKPYFKYCALAMLLMFAVFALNAQTHRLTTFAPVFSNVSVYNSEAITQFSRPIYPTEATAKRISGGVKLALLIDTDGRVVDYKIIESVPPGVFDETVVNHTKRLRFKPLVIDKEPMPFETRMSFAFVLD